MTEGQRLALEQLRDLEAESEHALEVLSVRETRFSLAVDVAISCRGLAWREGGIRFRNRERFTLYVPGAFPFSKPEVETSHNRFAGYPHVQWGRHLCLYVAPDSEWNASDGILGFIERLEAWLRQAALGELDPANAPLHPPVAYPSGGRLVVPRADTPPEATEETWFGLASLKLHGEHRADVVSWAPLGSESVQPPVATAVLLHQPFTFFEYPGAVRNVLLTLQEQGVPLRSLFATLQLAVHHNSDEHPLLFVLGAPMRGIRATGELKQHLVVWEVDQLAVQALRLSLSQYDRREKLREIGDRAEQIFWEWAGDAKIRWCSVREDRPEVTIRRDAETAVTWFRGKRVAVWGCGALGGHIADFLARAGVKELRIYDESVVTPGVLVRQPFEDEDIGRAKVNALTDRLRRVRPDLTINKHAGNVIAGPLAANDWYRDLDLVIDATASRAVSEKLETVVPVDGLPIPVASVVVGHDAEKAMLSLCSAGFSGGPADVARQVQLDGRKNAKVAPYLEEFWPDEAAGRSRLFQPEPGCSDPTFVGSVADLAAMSGILVDCVGEGLRSLETGAARAVFITLPQRAAGKSTFETVPVDGRMTFQDETHGYRVRIAKRCWQELDSWIKRNDRTRGRLVETGGLLFGERDDASGVVWTDHVTGPPIDSRASEHGFVCGTVGMAAKDRALRKKTEGLVRYVGLWHTHPEGPPNPSSIDYAGMADVLLGSGRESAKALMLIIGNTASGGRDARALLFSRTDVHANRRYQSRLATRPVRPVLYGTYVVWQASGRSMSIVREAWRDLAESVKRFLRS